MAFSTNPIDRTENCFKKPQRITTTVSWKTLKELQAIANDEGRSLSNLVAFALELHIKCNNR